MSPALPTWLDAADLDLLRAPSEGMEFERYALAGRILLSVPMVWLALRREVRATLLVDLRRVGVAPIARRWEGRFDLLAAIASSLGTDAPTTAQILALAHTRHEVHALRAVLVHASLASPPLAERTLDRAETLGASIDHQLAALDASIDPRLPALRRAVAFSALDPDERRWLDELRDAAAPPSSPWWIDLVDATMVLPAPVAARAVGLGATLEPGRDVASWRFERGLVVALFLDVKGTLIAALRHLPPAFDPEGLRLEWIHDEQTQRAVLTVDDWGDWSARPDRSVLDSAIVSLRLGDRFFVRLEE